MVCTEICLVCKEVHRALMLLRVSNWKSKDGVGFVSPYECMDSLFERGSLVTMLHGSQLIIRGLLSSGTNAEHSNAVAAASLKRRRASCCMFLL